MGKKLLLKSQNVHLRIGHFLGICILSFLSAFIIISCTKKEANLQDDIVENDITFHDGRLIFKDDSTFINHQRWLFANQGNRQLIADRNKSLGLKSMTEYYFEGMKLEESDPLFLTYVDKYPDIFNKVDYDNSTLYMLPHSMLLCYVANKDGIYQVGDKINRITNKYILQINASDESKIKMLLLPKDQISDKDLKVIPSSSDTKGDWAQRTKYFTSNTKYRIVSSLNMYQDGIIWYYDIITNPQRKVLFIWGRTQIATKAAKGTGYVNAMNGGPWPVVPNYNENTGLSSVTIAMEMYPINLAASYCPAYSRGKLNQQYIYVYWPNALDGYPPVEEPEWTPDVEPF